jgi:monoterpene epsilon-lactone hydrolase
VAKATLARRCGHPVASHELQLVIELCKFSRQRRRPTALAFCQLEELRYRYDEIADGNQISTKVICEPVKAGRVSAEWISGSEASPNRVILYLHGGCYATGSVETHRDLISRLSIAAGMPVLGLNYRLAPMHPFPAAVEDAAAAYRWLIETGIEPAHIAIVGDSAGAGLALATTITMRDDGLPLPAAVVCLSPWVDLAVTGTSMESKASEDPVVSRDMLLGWGKLYLGDHDQRTPLASPLYADLHRLPPLLIQVGSAEVLLDDATRLATRAADAGVDTRLEVWPEMIHVWQNFAAILPEARQAIDGIGSFVREHLEAWARW